MEKIDRKGILIHIVEGGNKVLRDEYLEEFRLLVETLNYEVVAETTYVLREPHHATLLGKGKIEETKNLIKITSAKIVFIDTTLTFLQMRTLSKEMEVPVIDRPHLILMIFSMRARTNEAKLQVELTQLKMRLPEIVHSDVNLDQQTGSLVGLKGPGERKTELRRRYIEKRIQMLEKKLEQIRKHRFEIRKRRKKSNIPIISIVGYTNAGKSTLINVLTHSNAYVEDKLFATLDSLARVGKIEGLPVIFVDTIGFIRDLPPQLVYAFHSTLEEILDSWIIIHLIDISDPLFREKIDVILKTLKELGINDSIPLITVFNKIDNIEEGTIEYVKHVYNDAIFISALNGINLDILKEEIYKTLKGLIKRVKLFIPYDKAYIIDEIYNSMHVVYRKDEASGSVLVVEGYYTTVSQYKNFWVNP